MFKLEELEQMSKEQLVLYIMQIQTQLEEIAETKKARAGVVLTGARPYVKEYVDRLKDTLARGGKK